MASSWAGIPRTAYGICRPFRDQMKQILELVDGTEEEKEFSASMKGMMSTFSLIGTLLLAVVYSVSGNNIESISPNTMWGCRGDTVHTVYKALTACTAVLCILLVGTTARMYLVLDLLPGKYHKQAILEWTPFYFLGVPYLLFGIILFMVGGCITLQASLTTGKYAGWFVAVFLWAMSILFLFGWVHADSVPAKLLPREANISEARQAPTA